jgi:hypothetical protein
MGTEFQNVTRSLTVRSSNYGKAVVQTIQLSRSAVRRCVNHNRIYVIALAFTDLNNIYTHTTSQFHHLLFPFF